MIKKYWAVMCHNDHGWGAVYDGLWGYENRIHSSKEEAQVHADNMRRDTCWRDTNPKCDPEDGQYDPDYDWHSDIPEFYVQEMSEEEIAEEGYHLREDMERINAAAALGRKGGASKSDAKVQAARDNGKKGGRPRKPRE